MYRYLQWSSNQGSVLNTTREKLCTPRQFQKNGGHEIGPVRSSQFLEEKRWPPSEFTANQLEEKIADFSNICSAKNSQYLLQQNVAQPYSKWNCRYNTLEQNLETPTRLEVNIQKHTHIYIAPHMEYYYLLGFHLSLFPCCCITSLVI